MRRAVRRAETALRIPRRVYEEIGGVGADATNEYPSTEIQWQAGIEGGWIVVADTLDYTNPLVATVMDQTRRFIANDTDRDEDRIEKTDTALVGLAAQLLETRKTAEIVLLTTDKPAGRAAEALLPKHGFQGQIKYRYVSSEYLETLSPTEFDGSLSSSEEL